MDITSKLFVSYVAMYEVLIPGENVLKYLFVLFVPAYIFMGGANELMISMD